MKQLDKSSLHKFCIESFESRISKMKKTSYEKEKLIFNLAMYIYILSHLLLQNINIAKKVIVIRNVENVNFPLLIMSLIYLSCKFLKHLQKYIIQGKTTSKLMNAFIFMYYVLSFNVIICLMKLQSRHGLLTLLSCITVM